MGLEFIHNFDRYVCNREWSFTEEVGSVMSFQYRLLMGITFGRRTQAQGLHPWKYRKVLYWLANKYRINGYALTWIHEWTFSAFTGSYFWTKLGRIVWCNNCAIIAVWFASRLMWMPQVSAPAIEFCKGTIAHVLALSLLYCFAIFAGRRYMEGRKPYNLRLYSESFKMSCLGVYSASCAVHWPHGIYY